MMKNKWIFALAGVAFAIMVSLCLCTVTMAKSSVTGGAGVNPMTGDNTPMIITILVIIIIAAVIGISALVSINKRRWL